MEFNDAQFREDSQHDVLQLKVVVDKQLGVLHEGFYAFFNKVVVHRATKVCFNYL